MPLMGSDSLLEQSLKAAIFAGLQAEFNAGLAPSGGYSAVAAQQHLKLASAIAKMALPLIAHIVANTIVAPGAPVSTPAGPGAVSGPGVLL